MRQVSWVDDDARVGLNRYVWRYLTRTRSKWSCDTSERDVGARGLSGSQRYMC
jgi:hypothetical protein